MWKEVQLVYVGSLRFARKVTEKLETRSSDIKSVLVGSLSALLHQGSIRDVIIVTHLLSLNLNLYDMRKLLFQRPTSGHVANTVPYLSNLIVQSIK